MGQSAPRILIPSRGRANHVTTTKVYRDCTLVVAESQAADYARHNPGVEILTHPDAIESGVNGGFAVKLQWMIDQFKDEDLFLLDDDVVAVNRCFETKAKNQPVTMDEAMELVEMWADMARDLGFHYFGAGAPTSNPLNYGGQKPFRLSGRIYSCGTGILKGSKLFFHPKIHCLMDYWMSCLNAYHHRGAFIDERFCISTTKPLVATEGAAHNRNLPQLKRERDILIEYFGSDICRPKVEKVRAKLKNPYQITLYLPF